MPYAKLCSFLLFLLHKFIHETGSKHSLNAVIMPWEEIKLSNSKWPESSTFHKYTSLPFWYSFFHFCQSRKECPLWKVKDQSLITLIYLTNKEGWRSTRIDYYLMMTSQRDAINEILRYASKNRLPEGLKEQMLAHMQLKFKTAELQQEEVLEDLPKAIRSSIAQHLFHGTAESTYLFKGVSDNLIIQLVSHFVFPLPHISYHVAVS